MNHKGRKRLCTQGCFPAPIAVECPELGDALGRCQKKFLQQEVCEESKRLREGSWKGEHACIGFTQVRTVTSGHLVLKPHASVGGQVSSIRMAG